MNWPNPLVGMLPLNSRNLAPDSRNVAPFDCFFPLRTRPTKGFRKVLKEVRKLADAPRFLPAAPERVAAHMARKDVAPPLPVSQQVAFPESPTWGNVALAGPAS